MAKKDWRDEMTTNGNLAKVTEVVSGPHNAIERIGCIDAFECVRSHCCSPSSPETCGQIFEAAGHRPQRTAGPAWAGARGCVERDIRLRPQQCAMIRHVRQN